MRMTKEELRVARVRALEKTNLSEEQLRERGENFQLHHQDRVIYDTIQGIDYLLEED